MKIIEHALNAREPVAILGANVEEMDRLRAVAGLPAGATLPEGIAEVEVYALDTDDEGDIYELTVMPPLPSFPVQVVSVAEDGVTPVVTEREEPFTGQAEVERSLAALTTRWLAQNADRDDAPESALPVALALDSPSAETDLRGRLDELARSTESRVVFSHYRNIHQLITNVWSVHSKATNEDWFYVRQQGLFSASNEVFSDTELGRGWYAYLYDVHTTVDGFTSNAGVFLDTSSPATTEGRATVTSSIGWDLSGELSFSAKGASPALGASVSIERSYSYEIPDVTVRNQSGSQLNNVRWQFAIARPHFTRGLGCLGASDIGPMSQVSRSTFQPVGQWIWRVGPRVRSSSPSGLPIRVAFQTAIGQTYTKPFSPFFEEDLVSSVMAKTTVVPWPPRS